MRPSTPYVKILLVGNERIGKRSLLESFIGGHLWGYNRYTTTQISDEFPNVLFDTAEGMQPRAIGKRKQSLRTTAINAMTLQEIWGFGDPWGRWPPTRSLQVQEDSKSINPQVIGICFSVGDHKALDGVKNKV